MTEGAEQAGLIIGSLSRSKTLLIDLIFNYWDLKTMSGPNSSVSAGSRDFIGLEGRKETD